MDPGREKDVIEVRGGERSRWAEEKKSRGGSPATESSTKIASAGEMRSSRTWAMGGLGRKFFRVTNEGGAGYI